MILEPVTQKSSNIKFCQYKVILHQKYFKFCCIIAFNQLLMCFYTKISERIVKNKQKLRKLVKNQTCGLKVGKNTIKWIIRRIVFIQMD